MPFEEYCRRPYIGSCAEQIAAQHTATEVIIMGLILSLYAAILALAIWQERHGAQAHPDPGTDADKQGMAGTCCNRPAN
ncbi:MAG: hypothetical protein KDI16_15130 [Halioglobus sp.]|nr:hypothetical protein [Halioglobus sp.]